MADTTIPPTPSTNGASTPPDRGQRSKSTLGVAAVVVVALIALFWPRDDGPKPVPNGTLIDDQGHPVELAERLGPVSLIHFWSTWCFGCLDEVPEILRLEAGQQIDPEFTLVMVAVQDDRRAVEEFITARTDPRHVLHDNWDVAKLFGTRKLPETHLVVDGKIVDTFVGVVDWNDPGVSERMRSKVKEARATG